MGRLGILWVLSGICLFATPALSESHGDADSGYPAAARPAAPEAAPSIPMTATVFTHGERKSASAIRLTVKPKTQHQDLVVGNYLIRVWLFQKEGDGAFRVSVAVWDRTTRSRLPFNPRAHVIPPGRSVGSFSNARKEPYSLEEVSLQGEVRDGANTLRFAVGNGTAVTGLGR